MLDPVKKTIMYDHNAIWHGYSIDKLMENAGRGIARILIKKYGRGKRIGFFCGPGNNGGDGFAAARHLGIRAETGAYLIPDSAKIKTKESKLNWRLYKGKKQDNVRAQDIPNNFDIVVECLFGTGIEGRLRAPYPAIINKLNSLKAKKVTIDMPAPGFKANHYISMMFPKTKGADVVDIGYPEWLEERIGVGEVKVLAKPGVDSHKGDNGKVLIIGGSEQYHGAPILAAKILSKIVDLVYFASTPENNELIKKMRSRLAEFIAVGRSDLQEYARKSDVILIGPGLGAGKAEEKLVNGLLKKFKAKKFVLDAGALPVADKKLLGKNVIITPHKQEFKTLFRISGNKENAGKMARRHKCVIVLKGKVDFVCDAQRCKENMTGNAAMTRGGTGDVLAGLIAGLAAQNDLFLAASAGVFLNGLAGDRLLKKKGRMFSASDLVKELPRTLKWCEKF